MIRFSLKQKNVQNFPAGAGADFSANLQICHWHCDADAMVRKLQFHDYWASRGGRAAKMTKIAFSSGRCRKHWKSRSHAAWQSNKKWSARSMGMLKTIFATPLDRECLFEKVISFCCCEFWWIWGSEKVPQIGMPLRFSFFWKKITLNENCPKWNCC